MQRARWATTAAKRLGRFRPALLLVALLGAGLTGSMPATHGQILPAGPPPVTPPRMQTVAVPGRVSMPPGGTVVFDLPLPVVTSQASSPSLSAAPSPLPLQPGETAPLPKVIVHWASSGSRIQAMVSDDGMALTIAYASGLVVITDRACSAPSEFIAVCPHPQPFPAPNALYEPYRVNFAIADALYGPDPRTVVLRPGQQTASIGGFRVLAVRYEDNCCKGDNNLPAGVTLEDGAVLLTPPPGYYILPLLPDVSGCVPAVGSPGPMRCPVAGTPPLLIRFSTFNDASFGAHSTPPPPPNPVLTVQAPPAPALVGQEIAFSASVGMASSMRLPDSFVWDFGDGSVAQGQSVSHAYAAPGTYAVVLEESDPFGYQDLPAVAQVVAADAAVPPESVTVVYAAGWNLVAGPAGTVFAGADGPLYTLPLSRLGQGGKYQPLSADGPTEPGTGYWAYFPEDTSLTLSASPQPVVITPPAANDHGYILVGNPFTVPASVTGADDVELYYGDSGFITRDILQPGDGALVLPRTGQRIIIAPVVP